MPSEADLDHPKRQAILKLARAAFIRDGFAATKVEPIAREAGISTATLYALFPGKAELFEAVIADAEIDFEERMRRVRMIDGPARAQVAGFASAYADFMADPFIRAVFRLVMAERHRFKSVARKFFERGKTDFGGLFMQALARLSDAGELKPLKASWAAGQLMGMVEHPLFFMPLVTGDEVLPRRGIDQVVEDAVETFMARYGSDQG